MNNIIKHNRTNFEQFVDLVDWARSTLERYPDGLSLIAIGAKVKADLGFSPSESTLRSACAKSGLTIVSTRGKNHGTDDMRFLAALVADVGRGVRDGWSVTETARLSHIRAGKRHG